MRIFGTTVFAALLSSGFHLSAASAQDIFSSAQSTANFAVGLCLFPNTLDLAGQLAVAKGKARATGLPVMVETDENGMYGDPSGVFVVVTKTVDSLTCLIQIAPPAGTQAAFETIESTFAVEYQVRFPGFLESIDDDPSPHIDGHDWIVRTPVNDSIITSIDFGTEDGISITGVTKKEYD